MTDESRFRSRRGQEYPQPHQSGAVARVRRGEDPLAELARLIGQEDPFAEFVPINRNIDPRTSGNNSYPRQAHGHDGRSQVRRRGVEPDHRPEADYDDAHDPRYAEAPRSNGRGAYSYRGSRDAYEEQVRPAAARGTRDYDGYAPARAERTQAPSARDQEAYYEQDQEAYSDPRYARRIPAEPAYDDGGHDQYRDSSYDPNYADDGYLPAHSEEVYDDAPHRPVRRWLMIAGVLIGVTLLAGTSIFAYRALFDAKIGGQPKVIKSESTPSKVLPGSDSQSADASGQKKILDRVGGDRPGSGERIVSREEEPIAAGSKNLGSRMPSPGGTVAATGPQVIPSSSQAAPASTEPKRVRTLSVRADGSVIGDQSASRSSVTGSTQRNAPQTPPPASGSNQPLTLNTYAPQPGQAATPQPPAPPANTSRISATPAQNENPWANISANTQPEPTRTATVSPAQSASPAPAAARGPIPTVAVQTPPPAGSYIVQVSSQKNEADAQATWLKLRERYSAVLANQQATIRKVDLGDRGTFYRAQLGPFSTREQASELCQSLKSAGGECVIQRN